MPRSLQQDVLLLVNTNPVARRLGGDAPVREPDAVGVNAATADRPAKWSLLTAAVVDDANTRSNHSGHSNDTCTANVRPPGATDTQVCPMLAYGVSTAAYGSHSRSTATSFSVDSDPVSSYTVSTRLGAKELSAPRAAVNDAEGWARTDATDAVAGGVHLYHTLPDSRVAAPESLHAWSGSPASSVANAVVELTAPDAPENVARLAYASFAGGAVCSSSAGSQRHSPRQLQRWTQMMASGLVPPQAQQANNDVSCTVIYRLLVVIWVRCGVVATDSESACAGCNHGKSADNGDTWITPSAPPSGNPPSSRHPRLTMDKRTCRSHGHQHIASAAGHVIR